jgi:aminopeptidase
MSSQTSARPSRTASLTDEATRTRYAEAIIGTCLDIAVGEVVVIRGEPAHRELVVALSEAAYRAGARHVDPWYVDPRVRRARIAHAPEDALGALQPWEVERLRAGVGPKASVISITGEEHPNVFADLAAARVAEDFRRPVKKTRWFMRAQIEEKVRFCVVPWPTEAWAGDVYPDLAPADAIEQLGRDLLWFCRLDPKDDERAWPEHLAGLIERARALSERPIRAIELRGPGTSLDLGIAPGTRFLTAASENAYGQTPCVNYPTEEVYTSPVAAATEGTFRCSRPLSLQGRLIDGIEGEFRRGRLVRLSASRESDRDLFLAYLDTDRGARRLGELALVDGSSRIGQTGRIYNDTLIDENAATHIAFGSGFRNARCDEAGWRTVNESATHQDVMVGSDELDVTAIEQNGARVPLIAGGEWQL